MTKIISEKLLQPNMWQDKLYQISFIDKLVGWLGGPNGREKFRSVLYEVAQRAYRYAQKGGTQASIASHIRKYLKQQPLVSFFQDRLISLLEDPNSNMFNDAMASCGNWSTATTSTASWKSSSSSGVKNRSIRPCPASH